MQTLSRTQHLHNSFLLLQKPLFRPEEKSLSSISLFRGAKTERKRYRKGVSFPFSSAEKIKKNRGEHPKKRKTKFFQHRLHGPKFFSLMMMRANKNAPPPLLTNNANVAWTSNSRRNNQTYFIVTARAEERACGRDVGQTERVFRTERKREREQISPFKIFSPSFLLFFGHESFAPNSG